MRVSYLTLYPLYEVAGQFVNLLCVSSAVCCIILWFLVNCIESNSGQSDPHRNNPTQMFEQMAQIQKLFFSSSSHGVKISPDSYFFRFCFFFSSDLQILVCFDLTFSITYYILNMCCRQGRAAVVIFAIVNCLWRLFNPRP